MLITLVLNSATDDDDITTIRVRGDSEDVVLTLDPQVVSQLLMALQRASWRLRQSDARSGWGAVYQVTDCWNLTTETDQGLVVQTREGFEIALALDPAAQRAVSLCMQQIRSPDRPT